MIIKIRTWRSGRIPPRSEQTRPNDELPKSTSLSSNNQSYPWWQPRTSSTSITVKRQFGICNRWLEKVISFGLIVLNGSQGRSTYQKWTEEYKRYEIHVGHVGTTFRRGFVMVFRRCTRFALVTRQHNRRPRFARSASAILLEYEYKIYDQNIRHFKLLRTRILKKCRFLDRNFLSTSAISLRIR